MDRKKAARRSCSYERAMQSPAQQIALADDILSNEWTRAQCKAIELSLGGGFLALTLMAVVAW